MLPLLLVPLCTPTETTAGWEEALVVAAVAAAAVLLLPPLWAE
jgi:hypothetical protein